MHKFLVSRIESIGHDTILVTLSPKHSGRRISFAPGQYAAIGYKINGRPSVTRCFSIVSSPNQNELQFAIRVIGDFTHSVAQLKKRDKVFVYGPFGDFIIDPRQDRNVIMLAGGIGVTPFISMVRAASESRLGIPITLLYSVQNQDNIPFFEELLRLQANNPLFRVVFFVTRGEVDHIRGRVLALKGRINEQRLKKLTAESFNRFSYFICGTKNFRQDLTATLLSNGTDQWRIISEDFSAANKDIQQVSHRHKAVRFTYGMTAAGIILGTVFIMAIDLVRFVPKVTTAEARQVQSSKNASQSSPTTSSTPATSQTGNSGVPTNSSGSSNSSVSPSSTTTTAPTQAQAPAAQTYQPPVTAVS